mmetsp:Transcript_13931/g.25621  ORF Transcript_13931/g.25621 Transcript_13931/m.25621 type:complete len:201 (+) Transcript_13931:298-900(+)
MPKTPPMPPMATYTERGSLHGSQFSRRRRRRRKRRSALLRALAPRSWPLAPQESPVREAAAACQLSLLLHLVRQHRHRRRPNCLLLPRGWGTASRGVHRGDRASQGRTPSDPPLAAPPKPGATVGQSALEGQRNCRCSQHKPVHHLVSPQLRQTQFRPYPVRCLRRCCDRHRQQHPPLLFPGAYWRYYCCTRVHASRFGR